MAVSMTGQMLHHRMLAALEKEGKIPQDKSMRGVIRAYGLERFKKEAEENGYDVLPEWLEPYEPDAK